MESLLDWAINRGGAWAILAIVGPLIAWHLKQAKIDIAESIARIERLEKQALLGNGDLEAALNKFKLQLLEEMTNKFVNRTLYESRYDDIGRQLKSIDSRLERHEAWHMDQRRKQEGSTPWPPVDRGRSKP